MDEQREQSGVQIVQRRTNHWRRSWRELPDYKQLPWTSKRCAIVRRRHAGEDLWSNRVMRLVDQTLSLCAFWTLDFTNQPRAIQSAMRRNIVPECRCIFWCYETSLASRSASGALPGSSKCRAARVVIDPYSAIQTLVEGLENQTQCTKPNFDYFDLCACPLRTELLRQGIFRWRSIE